MNRFLLRWGASLLLAGLTGAAAAQSLLVSANGAFTFPQPLDDLGSYAVTIAQQPVGLPGQCGQGVHCGGCTRCRGRLAGHGEGLKRLFVRGARGAPVPGSWP